METDKPRVNGGEKSLMLPAIESRYTDLKEQHFSHVNISLTHIDISVLVCKCTESTAVICTPCNTDY